VLGYLALLRHYTDGLRWIRLSPAETRRRQVARFRQLFEHARAHSPFYRNLYREAGVEKLVIRDMADVEQVPSVDKAMLRAVPTQEIMTRPIRSDLVRITTSGSTGEPFDIFQTKAEQYTSHARVFAMLWELGWRPWHPILMLTRLEPDAVLPVEEDLGLLTQLRQRLGLFQRDIASIYTPMPEVVRWLDAGQDARVFWSTPGIVTVLCDYLEQQGLRYRFDLVVLTSETLSCEQRARFERLLGGPVISHYGLMECPTIGHDPGDGRHFRIQGHACLLETVNHRVDQDRQIGDVVLTNLVNHTMPFIRYRTGDTAEV
jgi:phenylacetate-coenzyme A ligase PaaK-like adenylate-forming protein